MDLGGAWRIAEPTEELRRRLSDPDLDDHHWAEAPVPGHWRSVPGFEASHGPVLYRRRFQAETHGEGRTFLVLDGIFYQSDVWLDHDYLGDTEGYFFPHHFEVTGLLAARPEHVLGIEVTCQPQTDRAAKRNLTGVFQHWDCIDPDWNPGGIWAGVRLERTGPLRIEWLKVLCPEATEERALLDLEACIDAPAAGRAEITSTVDGPTTVGGLATVAARTDGHALSAGPNVLRWRLPVDRPQLWWPRSLGPSPLHQVTVEAAPAGGECSDRRQVSTGLRSVKVRNFVASVNGERLFLKGANHGPTRRDPGAATAREVAADVELAAGAGLDLLRVHAHVAHPELYAAADRQGMLLWQDLPLQWGYANVRRQAVRQAHEAVRLLGHHPSIALWCGHNEPLALDMEPGAALAPRTVARFAAGQVLPTWNKTVLDRSIRRALERADPSREVVAHSGVVPHPAWGTDSHFYFGWYHGEERDFPAALARFPVMARFVSEFGAQAVPDAAAFMEPERWPDLDWERLVAHHCLQLDVFENRIPPADHPTFEGWRDATQAYQAVLLRHHIEALRRLKYRPTGGFCLFLLADALAAVTWSILDAGRRPKAGYRAVQAACAPVIITADRPAPSYRPGEKLALSVHVVSDLRSPLPEAVATARVSWPGGERRWAFGGRVEADSCTRVGRIELLLPRQPGGGRLDIDLALRWPGGSATNRYSSWIQVPDKGKRRATAESSDYARPEWPGGWEH